MKTRSRSSEGERQQKGGLLEGFFCFFYLSAFFFAVDRIIRNSMYAVTSL